MRKGRLVLADALCLGAEEAPDLMISMATLTGAARVAVGPDLSPFYSDDEAVVAALEGAAREVADPVWRMPFWEPYEEMIEPGGSPIWTMRLRGGLCRVDHRRAVPAPLCRRGRAIHPFRYLRLAAESRPGAAQGRRWNGRARDSGRAARGAGGL